MGKKQTIDYTALNLQIFKDNVSDKTYIELFKILETEHREIPLTRDNYLHLMYLKPINLDNPMNGFKGRIFKRNSLPNDWYNTEEGTRNLKENVEDKYIPGTLKAKVRFFDFAFYPLHKILVCEIHNSENKISEHVIQDFLKKLLNTPKLNSIFKRIEINLVPEKITAEKIFSTPQLTKLELNIQKINEFSNDKSLILEKEIYQDMIENNISTYTRVLISEKTKFLNLNSNIKNFITVALKHGFVTYKFKNVNDMIETKSSHDTAPYIKRVTYDTKTTDLYELFLRETAIISESLSGK